MIAMNEPRPYYSMWGEYERKAEAAFKTFCEARNLAETEEDRDRVYDLYVSIIHALRERYNVFPSVRAAKA